MAVRSITLARRRFLQQLGGIAGGLAVASLAACGGAASVATSTGSAGAASTAPATAATTVSAATTASATTTPAAATASSASASSASASSAAASASSAASATTSGPKLVAPAAAKATLRLSSWGALTAANAAVYNAFMAQNADIGLIYDVVGTFSDYFTKVQAQTASGDAPDVITHSPYYHVIFAARKVTRVLDDLVAQDKVDLTQLYPPVVASCRWQPGRIATGVGKLYVMPANNNTGTLYFYNKTLFDQAGVSHPDDTWTWDTMRDNAAKMTRPAGAGAQQWGLGVPQDGNGRINTWIWEAGGDFFNADFTACTLQSDGKALDAFTYLVDLIQKDKVAQTPKDGSTTTLFANGQIAMTPGGQWWSPTFDQTKRLDWDVFLPPKHPTTGSRTIDVYTNGLAIGTTSKHVPEAWRFIKWYTVGDGLPVEMANYAGFVPAHIATAEKYVFTPNRTGNPKSLSLYSDVLKQAHPTFVVVGEGDIAKAIGPLQTNAFNGTDSVNAAATNIQQVVTSILNQQRALLGTS